MPENRDIASMKLMLSFESKTVHNPLSYRDKLLFIGSCFSDNVGAKLEEAKFQVRYNPTGILFDPLSLSKHLHHWAENKRFMEENLFEANGLWHSWLHHSDFSSPTASQTLESINSAIQQTHQYLLSANYLFITLGTAYSYHLKREDLPVANCHKTPGEWFTKNLISIEETVSSLEQGIKSVREVNPAIQVVFTVSPVKHLRDGIIENTRSKARLIEAVHQLTDTVERCSYFPAYELVTDVLRDYRFYAEDMAHPGNQAVRFVLEHFCQTYMESHTRELMSDVLQIISAQKHRPLHPNTPAHRQFLKFFLEKTNRLKEVLPMVSWDDQLRYFSSGS